MKVELNQEDFFKNCLENERTLVGQRRFWKEIDQTIL